MATVTPSGGGDLMDAPIPATLKIWLKSLGEKDAGKDDNAAGDDAGLPDPPVCEHGQGGRDDICALADSDYPAFGVDWLYALRVANGK